MSDTTKSVDDELYQKITDICLENGGVTKPMVDRLYALFTKQLQEAEIRARIDESTPNASDDGKAVRVHVPQRNHIIGTDYDKGWNDCWEAFWSARWKRVGELTQDTKGGTDDTPRV